MGGIKGISNSSINLDEYFLSTGEISNIITPFCNKFGISESDACKREDHLPTLRIKEQQDSK